MNIEEEIQAIKVRNQKVEIDKAWEISLSRRLFIAVMTYLVALIWLVMINDTMPWLKAFVPAAGYALSTLTLRMVKNRWAAKYFQHP